MFLVSWSGVGFLSPAFLIGGMLASIPLLRSLLTSAYGLQAAVYLGNGFGLMQGALANLIVFTLISRFTRAGHSFLAFGPRAWSLIGLVGGLAMAAYGWSLSVPG
ncbi:hypothetical protein GCM10007301_40780 [Azorhizobium oxalatiphilum]|uniref:Uncharacterized protein n=1 Tax=Azorhizobium oxalatiphilum TaxID=980631 RepID=A0A917FGZ6_9HYPH|nr:hypothetical protein [Azorhizobium oxalatiphilum]GGF76750.1 hypothetical protein GCM10007301_40780 [Azorhizobium oxalatiphilum]